MFKTLVKHIFIISNFAAAILLLFSYLASIVHPCKTVMFSFIALGYPVILLVNLGFIVFWIVNKKHWYLVSILAIAIGYKPLVRYINILPHKADVKEQSQTEIKVASYNVRVFNLYNWKNNKAMRDSILQYVKLLSPEIICFQEYYNHTGNYFPVTKPLMKQRFKNSHVHVISTLNGNQQFGIATFTTFPIKMRGQVKFSDTGNVAIYTDINVKGQTIRVYNCHLESVRLSYSDYNIIDSLGSAVENKKVKEAKGIYRRLARAFCKRGWQAGLLHRHIQKSPYPVIVCGDFNDTPTSYTYATIAKGLYDSHLENNFWRGITFQRNFFHFRIDYQLHSKSIECKSFKVPKVDYSDHYPLIGTYIIPSP